MNLFEAFPQASVADLKMYFLESLIRLSIEQDKTTHGAPSWYEIQGFGGDVTRPDLVMVVSGFNPKRSYNLCIGDVQVHLNAPKLGLYNFKKSVVYLSRKPTRQNRKGICDATYDVFNLSSPAMNLLEKKNCYLGTSSYPYWCKQDISDYSVVLLDEWEKNQPDTFIEILEKIRGEKVFARKLNSQFAVSMGINSNNPTIWHGQIPIGEVLDLGRAVRIDVPLLKQESSDFFNQQGVFVV